MIISTVLVIILWVAAGALLLTAALSPLETLSWWAGWSEDEVGEEEQTKTGPDDQSSSTASPGRVYIVYLSGIATLSGRYLLRREKLFLQGLKTRLPDAAVISDVFPYSPAGVPLLESPRVFDRVWRGVQKLKIQRRSAILSGLINMRNIFQVMVSADHRYGPIFNQGAAHVIEKALLEAGYERNSGAPVTVIGYSGGGQIGVGAATFLSARLAAPVDVISIGGVIASGPGLAALRRLTMIYGPRDTIARIGAVVFPERWRLFPYSEWNRARQAGKVQARPMKGMIHAGPKGYFGLPKRDGVSNSERTIDAVATAIGAAGASRQSDTH